MTGCDTVSAFKGKGKKPAWEAWQVPEDVTDAFCVPCESPFQTP